MFVLGKIWYDSTMLVIEAKLKGTQSQYSKLDEAIRTGQFIRNTCLRYWEDNKGSLAMTSRNFARLDRPKT
jgi:hypothetical protein